jgi:hypothetical protein
MQDWAGWLLLLFSFGIVLMWKRVRSDTKVVHAIWFCIFLHQAVAFLNAYVGTVIGAGQDAAKFHRTGVELAALLEPVWVFDIHHGVITYTHSLGLLYRAFDASLIFGEELSVLAFTLSCVVLVKLVDLLDLGRFRIGIILLFGSLPSAVIFRSVTFRESWQALFFLLSVYWAIRLRKRPGILIFLYMLMSVFCMATLHNGLKGYAMYLVLISVYWGIFSCKKGVRLTRHVRFLFTGLLVACVIVLAQKMGWYLTIGHALEGADGFRQSAVTIQARTTYGVMLDTSSVLGLVKTLPLVFVYYMFAPFPWHVGNVKDIYALLESMLRFVLLFFAVSSWRRSSGEVRSYYGFLLIIFLGMELMWALGTINWGTATRHHVPGYSVIVLLGVPGLILFMRKLHFGMFGCRKDNTMLPK